MVSAQFLHVVHAAVRGDRDLHPRNTTDAHASGEFRIFRWSIASRLACLLSISHSRNREEQGKHQPQRALPSQPLANSTWWFHFSLSRSTVHKPNNLEAHSCSHLDLAFGIISRKSQWLVGQQR